MQWFCELLQIVAVELRVADDDAGRIDQRDAAAERGAGGVGERVGVDAASAIRSPTRRASRSSSRPCLLREPVRARRLPAIATTPATSSDDENERTDEQPLGEGHALRECPLLSR